MAVFSAPAAFAQNAERPVTLDTVIVTAQPEEEEPFQTGDVDPEQVSGFFAVIERDRFEGKVEDLSQVLTKEAGIQVRRTGGLGSYSTVSLRGSSSEQVLVFMDGILLNDASTGGVDLSNIALSDIAAIEVYRGISPLNFGKSSIGGVINIRTLRARDTLSANVRIGYGSFGTRTVSGFLNHKPGRWDYLVSAGHMASDNDFWILNDAGTDWNPYDDEWQTRANNTFAQNNLLAKAGIDLTPTLRLDLSNQWFDKDQHLPSWNNLATTRTSLETRRNTTVLKVTADAIGMVDMSGYIDYVWKKEVYDDRYGDIGLGRQHNEYLTQSFGAHYFLDWLAADWNNLSLVADARWETYEPTDLAFPGRTPNDSSRGTYAIGVQDTLYLFQDRLAIIPAARYTIIRDELDSAVSSFGIPVAGKSDTKAYVSPQIGIKFRALDWLTLKGNLARYTREPTFFELFGDRGFFLGNPDLRAEEGLNADAGLEVAWARPDAPISRVSVNAAWFRSDVDDIITSVYNAQGIGKSVNVSGAAIEGLESSLTVDFLDYFRLIANATWQDAVNQDPSPAFFGKQLAGRFEESYLARLEGRYRGITAYVETLLNRGMFYDTANLLEASDQEELNIGGSWLIEPFLLTVEAKNLTNERYETFNGFPQPGRSLTVSLKYTFRKTNPK